TAAQYPDVARRRSSAPRSLVQRVAPDPDASPGSVLTAETRTARARRWAVRQLSSRHQRRREPERRANRASSYFPPWKFAARLVQLGAQTVPAAAYSRIFQEPMRDQRVP